MNDAKVAAAGIELEKARAGHAARDAAPERHPAAEPGSAGAGHAALSRRRSARCASASATRSRRARCWRKIESNQSLTVYELRAPIAGTVIDRQAALGEYASEQKAAFIVADLTTVWVDFSVYRRDLAKVRGRRPQSSIDPEDGGAPIEAKVSYMSPVGSSDTQSALARAIVAQPEGAAAARPVRHRKAAARREAGRGRRQERRRCRPWRTARSCSCARREVRDPRGRDSARATPSMSRSLFGAARGRRVRGEEQLRHQGGDRKGIGGP